MQITLLRHGPTEANEQRLYCGQENPSLSAAGKDLIDSLAKEGIYPRSADGYFSSGLARAEETLTMLYGMVDRHIIPELGEYHFGVFEMKTHDELCPLPAYQEWIMDNSGDVSCPGGESRNGFTDRVYAAYATLLKITKEEEYQTVIAMTHGGVIATIMEMLFPNRYNSYEWQPQRGCGYTLVYDGAEIKGFTSIESRQILNP